MPFLKILPVLSFEMLSTACLTRVQGNLKVSYGTFSAINLLEEWRVSEMSMEPSIFILSVFLHNENENGTLLQ